MSTDIINIYSHIDIYLLIFVRIFGFFATIPVFGGQNIPSTTRVGLCLILSTILMSSEVVTSVYYGNSAIEYGLLVGKELLVGLIIDFTVYIVLSATLFAGQMIDFEIGFSMVSVFDPLTQIQVPVTGNLLYFLVSIVMVMTNGHHIFISALYYSYDAIPINGALLLGNNALMASIMRILSDYFVLGLQMAMPIIGSILILNVALGLLAKTAPQMNIFAVGMILKILIGLYILVLIMPIFIPLSENLIEIAGRAVMSMIKGMVP